MTETRKTRGGKKPAGALRSSSDRAARHYLEQLSKAALMDVVCDLVSQANQGDDDPATAEQVHAACEPVLFVRGDRIPSLISKAVSP
jgi:hypothetical protein